MKTVMFWALFVVLLLGILGFVRQLMHPTPSGKKGTIPSRKSLGLTMVGFVIVVLAVMGAVEPDSMKQARLDKAAAKAAISSQQQEGQQTEIKLTEEKPAEDVQTKTETKTEVVLFESQNQNDSTLASGTTKVSTVGVNGERTLTYKVTYTNGAETAREQTASEVTKQPVTQITKVGTKKATVTTPKTSSCDPNYGGCVPIASDVDCQGGSGNGPAYVKGPVKVIGTDIYGLDADHDGYGCE